MPAHMCKARGMDTLMLTYAMHRAAKVRKAGCGALLRDILGGLGGCTHTGYTRAHSHRHILTTYLLQSYTHLHTGIHTGPPK